MKKVQRETELVWSSPGEGWHPEQKEFHCYGCGELLHPECDVFATDYQFDNALWIKFDGGYGMFIDPMSEELEAAPRRPTEIEPGRFISAIPVPSEWTEEETAKYRAHVASVNHVVICHECAHELCEKIPWVAKLLNPHSSHSHKSYYHLNHPDHWGWDYDRRAAKAI